MPSALWQFGSSPHPTLPSQGAVERPLPDDELVACSQLTDVLPVQDSSETQVEAAITVAEESARAELSVETNDTRKDKKTKKKVTG